MAEGIRVAFERGIITLPVGAVLPRKKVPEAHKKTVKYRRIAKSISEIGIIEPLVVSRLGKRGGAQYLLLDGHVRLTALLELGIGEVRCLVSDDDEAFTYNKRVNRLATVQEHFMITRALERGVPEEKLAKALNVDIKLIKRRQTLLDRISPEAVELLKDKSINPTIFDVLRKMRPMRQVEVVELMATAGNWGVSYAKALLAATKQGDLANPERAKKVAGMTPEQMARMEREMESLQQDFKQIEASYGDDYLHLVLASGYISKLVDNKAIERYLQQHHGEILQGFKVIISATSLDQPHNRAA